MLPFFAYINHSITIYECIHRVYQACIVHFPITEITVIEQSTRVDYNIPAMICQEAKYTEWGYLTNRARITRKITLLCQHITVYEKHGYDEVSFSSVVIQHASPM